MSSERGAEVRASDAALIERIIERDETALAALYDRYAGMLASVLNRILRDTQAAEEILQDIFFQLWQTASRFDASRGSLAGWLMVIARHRAISRLRRHNPAAGEELTENSVVLPSNFESAMAQQQLLGRREHIGADHGRAQQRRQPRRCQDHRNHHELIDRRIERIGA